MTFFTRLVMLGALGAAACSTYARGLADPEGGPPNMGTDATMITPDAGARPDVPAPPNDGGAPSDAGAPNDDGGPATTFSCVSLCARVAGAGCDLANAGCVHDCADNLTCVLGPSMQASAGGVCSLPGMATTDMAISPDLVPPPDASMVGDDAGADAAGVDAAGVDAGADAAVGDSAVTPDILPLLDVGLVDMGVNGDAIKG